MERILYGKPIAEELDAKSKLIFTNFENSNDRKPKLTAITVGAVSYTHLRAHET